MKTIFFISMFFILPIRKQRLFVSLQKSLSLSEKHRLFVSLSKEVLFVSLSKNSLCQKNAICLYTTRPAG